MKIVSWNVNGLRACTRKGFAEWLSDTDAEVVGLQEVRARVDQLPEEIVQPDGWHSLFTPAVRPGYSGVGLYSRHPIEDVQTSLGVTEFDEEGRVQIVLTGGIRIANIYFPNGSGKNRDNSRIPFKLDFYRALFEEMEGHRVSATPTVVMGDFNTAHREIDLARPKGNQKTSGFCPEEREELDRWLNNGWVDSFRQHHPDTPEKYTWWSNRPGVRERNVGWRIDYAFVSENTKSICKDAWIETDTLGSDHCPIGVEIIP